MELSNLEIEQQVEYINAELIKGRTMVDIETNDYKVNERVIHKRLVRKGYKKVNNQYTSLGAAEVKKTKEVKEIKADHQEEQQEKKEVIQKYNSRKNVANTSNIDMSALSELVQMIEPLKEIIQEYNNSKNIIEVVPNDIKIQVVEEIKARLFKIDIKVSDSFDKFCREHREYKAQDLINTAVVEFLNRYS